LRKRIICLIVQVLLFLTLQITTIPASATKAVPNGLNTGPYVDKIIFKVIRNSGEQIRALQAGDIETIANFIDSFYYTILDEDIDIDLYNVSSNEYIDITINCAKYPLNISGLRRAFAYAFDKTGVAKDYWHRFARLHDSVVPYANDWCIEDDLSWHYYDAEPDIGNAILDSLNFFI
jgi:ABC-type transport system substrate-binding protein